MIDTEVKRFENGSIVAKIPFTYIHAWREKNPGRDFEEIMDDLPELFLEPPAQEKPGLFRSWWQAAPIILISIAFWWWLLR